MADTYSPDVRPVDTSYNNIDTTPSVPQGPVTPTIPDAKPLPDTRYKETSATQQDPLASIKAFMDQRTAMQNRAFQGDASSQTRGRTQAELITDPNLLEDVKRHTDNGFDYVPGRNNEAVSASQQGFGTRVGNDVANFGITLGAELAKYVPEWETNIDTMNKALNGDFKSLSEGLTYWYNLGDPNVVRSINQWQEEQAGKFVNFQSAWAEQHPLQNFIPFYGGEGGSDFGAVASTGGAYMLGGILKTLTDTALFTLLAPETEGASLLGIPAVLGKRIADATKALSKLQPIVNYLDDTIKSARKVSTMINGEDLLGRTLRAGNKLWNGVDGPLGLQIGIKPLLYNALVHHSEASTEAFHTEQEQTKRLVADYVERWGQQPTGDAMAQIRAQAKEAGVATGILNNMILSVTGSLQLGKILKGFPIANALYKESDDFYKLKFGDKAVEVVENTRKPITFGANQKWYEKAFGTVATAGRAAATSIPVIEGIEEQLQTAAADGSQAYYQYRNSKEGVSALDAFWKAARTGFGNAFTTNEGLLDFLGGIAIGGIFGGGGSFARSQYDKIKGVDPKELQKAHLDRVASFLNNTRYGNLETNVGKYAEQIVNDRLVNGSLRDKLQSTAATLGAAKTSGNLIEQEDQFAFQNLKNTTQFGYINQFVSTGQTSVLRDQLKLMHESLNDNPQEFIDSFNLTSQFKESDKQALGMLLTDFEKDIDVVEKQRKNIDQYVHNPYKQPTTKKNKTRQEVEQEQLYYGYEDWKNELLHNSYLAEKYKGRLSSLTQQVTSSVGDSRKFQYFLSPQGFRKMYLDDQTRESELYDEVDALLLETKDKLDSKAPKEQNYRRKNAEGKAVVDRERFSAANIRHETAVSKTLKKLERAERDKRTAELDAIRKRRTQLDKLIAQNFTDYDSTLDFIASEVNADLPTERKLTDQHVAELVQKAYDADRLMKTLEVLTRNYNRLTSKKGFEAFYRDSTQFKLGVELALHAETVANERKADKEAVDNLVTKLTDSELVKNHPYLRTLIKRKADLKLLAASFQKEAKANKTATTVEAFIDWYDATRPAATPAASTTPVTVTAPIAATVSVDAAPARKTDASDVTRPPFSEQEKAFFGSLFENITDLAQLQTDSRKRQFAEDELHVPAGSPVAMYKAAAVTYLQNLQATPTPTNDVADDAALQQPAPVIPLPGSAPNPASVATPTQTEPDRSQWNLGSYLLHTDEKGKQTVVLITGQDGIEDDSPWLVTPQPKGKEFTLKPGSKLDMQMQLITEAEAKDVLSGKGLAPKGVPTRALQYDTMLSLWSEKQGKYVYFVVEEDPDSADDVYIMQYDQPYTDFPAHQALSRRVGKKAQMQQLVNKTAEHEATNKPASTQPTSAPTAPVVNSPNVQFGRAVVIVHPLTNLPVWVQAVRQMSPTSIEVSEVDPVDGTRVDPSGKNSNQTFFMTPAAYLAAIEQAKQPSNQPVVQVATPIVVETEAAKVFVARKSSNKFGVVSTSMPKPAERTMAQHNLATKYTEYGVGLGEHIQPKAMPYVSTVPASSIVALDEPGLFVRPFQLVENEAVQFFVDEQFVGFYRPLGMFLIGKPGAKPVAGDMLGSLDSIDLNLASVRTALSAMFSEPVDEIIDRIQKIRTWETQVKEARKESQAIPKFPATQLQFSGQDTTQTTPISEVAFNVDKKPYILFVEKGVATPQQYSDKTDAVLADFERSQAQSPSSGWVLAYEHPTVDGSVAYRFTRIRLSALEASDLADAEVKLQEAGKDTTAIRDVLNDLFFIASPDNDVHIEFTTDKDGLPIVVLEMKDDTAFPGLTTSKLWVNMPQLFVSQGGSFKFNGAPAVVSRYIADRINKVVAGTEKLSNAMKSRLAVTSDNVGRSIPRNPPNIADYVANMSVQRTPTMYKTLNFALNTSMATRELIPDTVITNIVPTQPEVVTEQPVPVIPIPAVAEGKELQLGQLTVLYALGGAQGTKAAFAKMTATEIDALRQASDLLAKEDITDEEVVFIDTVLAAINEDQQFMEDVVALADKLAKNAPFRLQVPKSSPDTLSKDIDDHLTNCP